MSLFSELRRRNVIRVAIAYAVVAWLVAQVAELALDSFGSPDWVMKTLLLFLALGFPFAIIFAWAFEMTPEGLKREKDVDRSQSITQHTGRKLNYSIIAFLAVALVFSLATRDWSNQGADDTPMPEISSDETTIAVLPFVNMSDDKENEYFSDGISEELLNVLVKVEGLRVASRTSSFSFKGKDTPIPDIAEALNVEHVLEGSVRKAGDTIRITAQLIDVKTDSHLWSETYDRKLEDIFVIQDEISAHIVEALKVALGAGEVVETASKPTANLDAYEAYLKGRYLWQRRGGENIQKAIELFTQATEMDPEFARAWASLAAAHITFPTYANVEPEIHYRLALAHANQALELDPDIAEAHAVLGEVSRVVNLDNPAATAAHYLKAVELEPKVPTGYLWYAEFLLGAGRIDAALENVNIAIDLDPLHPGTLSVASSVHTAHGDFEKAEEYLRSAIDLGHPSAAFDLIILTTKRGRYDEALELAESSLSGEDLRGLQLFIDACRDPSTRARYLTEIKTMIPPEQHSFLIADYVHFGQIDDAFEFLETHTLFSNNTFVLWMPQTQPLREDSRFIDYIQSAGLIPYWDEFGWSPLCARDGESIRCH